MTTKTDWEFILKNTVRKGNCPGCGNPWWVERFENYTCTTCGKKIPIRALGDNISDRDYSLQVGGALIDLKLPEKFAIYAIEAIFVNNVRLRTSEYIVQSTQVVRFVTNFPGFRVIADGLLIRLWRFITFRGFTPRTAPVVYAICVLGKERVRDEG